VSTIPPVTGLIASLIPTFLLSRVALRQLEKWRVGKAPIVVAHLASWIVCAILVDGFLMVYGEKIPLEAAETYALPQMMWLVFDLALRRAV
jgi:hypothetical protein